MVESSKVPEPYIAHHGLQCTPIDCLSRLSALRSTSVSITIVEIQHQRLPFNGLLVCLSRSTQVSLFVCQFVSLFVCCLCLSFSDHALVHTRSVISERSARWKTISNKYRMTSRASASSPVSTEANRQTDRQADRQTDR